MRAVLKTAKFMNRQVVNHFCLLTKFNITEILTGKTRLLSNKNNSVWIFLNELLGCFECFPKKFFTTDEMVTSPQKRNTFCGICFNKLRNDQSYRRSNITHFRLNEDVPFG